MKYKILVLIGLLMIVTGCSNENLEKVTCKGTTKISDNATLGSEYVMYVKDGYVKMVVSTEAIKSSDEETLNTYKEKLDEVYSLYNQLPYYTNSIFIEEGYLTSITMINYEKINTDDLITIDENNSKLIEKGKVKLTTLKEMYISTGATCK